jgi:alkyl hydroperoxide reductase subunit AhpC
MTLSIGTKAPDFARSCKTSDGINLVRLSENFGKKNALLWFFRMASTGVCSLSTGVGVIQYAESSDDPEQQPNFAAIKATKN